MSTRKAVWQWSAAALGAVALSFLYLFDPAKGGFPLCPFHWLTGLQCPGCGSQRAMHDLLHGRVAEAFGHNALLVISIPLLAVQGAWGHIFRNARPPAASNVVVFAWAALVVGWGVLRNI